MMELPFYELKDDMTTQVLKKEEWVRRSWVGSRYKPLLVTNLPTGEKISTTFLNYNAAPFEPGAPVLFETMIFSSEDWTIRYRDCATALRHHFELVELSKHIGSWDTLSKIYPFVVTPDDIKKKDYMSDGLLLEIFKEIAKDQERRYDRHFQKTVRWG